MSDNNESNAAAAADSTTESETTQDQSIPPSSSNATTPTSSVTGAAASTSRIKAPTNFSGSSSSISKIGRPCSHAAPKAGPPPRDTKSMSRESDDNLSSINSQYTDMYQETVRRFTRSSLSPEMDRFSPSRYSFKSNSPYDLYVEATGRRRSSDHGAILTQDTEQFIIGQRVWVGGVRPGQIAYIGETHFAPGDWAGVVLDDPSGKNDGCVAGKRYFQCEPKRGIFSRLTRLTLHPMPGAQTPTSPLSKMSPDRSRTVSPTASIRSSFLRSPGKNGLTVGDRVIVSSGFGSRPGILRYLGETQFASGNWCGIELDEGSGKNDGSVDGIRYFECKPKYGVFVPIAKVTLSPSSKKTRLSRTGSRESLTSIGTMNSIATTNTSRLRLNAQRKSSSARLSVNAVTTPKTQFSMQEASRRPWNSESEMQPPQPINTFTNASYFHDLLREKQQHIEQLMIERDLDREDSQNQALQYQKNINELKTRIALLERQLSEERKKAEDLQFSIDEATFCGDELNAQTQVYKEKIHELESKIKDLCSGKTVADEKSANASAAVDELNDQLSQQSRQFETQISDNQNECQRLQENIEYLKKQNESLQQELVAKDQSLEKFSLSECGIENMRKELAVVKEEAEKERNKIQADFTMNLEEKSQEIKRLLEQTNTLKATIDGMESERVNIEDECRILREECKTRDNEVGDVRGQLAKLTAELTEKSANFVALNELVKTQEKSGREEKCQLEEKLQEMSQLRQEITRLSELKSVQEENLQKAHEELKQSSLLHSGLESKLKEAITADETNKAAINALELALKDLRHQSEASADENKKLHESIKALSDALGQETISKEMLSVKVVETESLLTKSNIDLKSAQDSITKLQHDLDQAMKNSQQNVLVKDQEITLLKADIEKLQNKTTALVGESSVAVQQISAKVTNLESQNKRLEEELKNANSLVEDQRSKAIQKDDLISSKLTELKSTTAALDSTTNILEKLKVEHDSVTTQKQALEVELKNGEDRCAQQQLELGDLSRKLESFQSKCNDLVKQNESLQQELLTLRTSNSATHNDIKKLNDEMQQKQNEIFNLTSSNETVRIQMAGQIEELQQKLEIGAKDCVDLKDAIHKSKEEISQKLHQITDLEEKSIKLELQLSDQQRQRENLQTKFDALLEQNESLQNNLTALRDSSSDSSSELIKLSQDLANKQKAHDEHVDKANNERASLESKLQSSQQQIDMMCSQVETLTQELKNVTDESFSRIQLLKQEQEKTGKQELDMADLQRKLSSFVAKCESLEEQNKSLQNDLNTLRLGSAGSNAEVVKLSGELAQKQKQLQQLTDTANSDRLLLESQLQDVKQSLQTSQTEVETLRSELSAIEILKTEQTTAFETAKKDMETKNCAEIKELAEAAALKQQTIIESFEAQLKNTEQSKASLDEAIGSLQKQIQLLQDELLKSQLDFKSKEADLQRKVETLKLEKEQLFSNLQTSQNEGSSVVTSLREENSRLSSKLESLGQELLQKDTCIVKTNSEIEQLRIVQSNTKSELDLELQKLSNALELSNADNDYKTKRLADDQSKIEDLKAMIESLKTFNENISATNAELAQALEMQEQEKCETANIFELFEMESDQNMEKLIEKLSSLKTELASTQEQLRTKETELKNQTESLTSAENALKQTQSTLNEAQSNGLRVVTQYDELQEAKEELKNHNLEMEEKLKLQLTQLEKLHESNKELEKHNLEMEEKLKLQLEFEQQLEEYKKIIDEMDDSSTEKSSKLGQLQKRIAELEQEQSKCIQREQAIHNEFANVQRKLEVVEMEKTKEIVALKQRISDLQAAGKVKENGASSNTVQPIGSYDDSTAQINFLNSIIADMQKKNDTLKAKIEALEALPTDFTKPKAFDLISKRKPAPRVFCDICDEFDKHETEDCPVQASDDRDYSPPPRAERNNNSNNDLKERKIPEPRKYCESCEVFGHEAGECDDDECY